MGVDMTDNPSEKFTPQSKRPALTPELIKRLAQVDESSVMSMMRRMARDNRVIYEMLNADETDDQGSP